MYSIYGTGRDRVLVVARNDTTRFKFFHKVANVKVPVVFRPLGNNAIAKVGRDVLVYRKPHAMTYHKELMRQNARALWLGSTVNPDAVLVDLLEYHETI